jgi:trehalose 6-phosphate phosphatase
LDLDAFVNVFKNRAQASGFVLDFDGTLSQIASKPSGVAPVAGSVDVLEALAAGYAVVALLSGRRAENLAGIVGAKAVRYVGVYGAEEYREGELIQPPEADRWRGMASRLARDAEALVLSEGLLGTEIEYKDLAVSIHYRNAERQDAAQIVRGWAENAAPKRGFDCGVGRKVVELRPRGVSKAGAFEKIVSETRLEGITTAGDDYADVEMLARARELMGTAALRIGMTSDEEPAGLRDEADLLCSSPGELVELLRKFL